MDAMRSGQIEGQVDVESCQAVGALENPGSIAPRRRPGLILLNRRHLVARGMRPRANSQVLGDMFPACCALDISMGYSVHSHFPELI
jgi:hypothetical protein